MQRAQFYLVVGPYFITYHELFDFTVMKHGELCSIEESNLVIFLFW